MRGTPSRASEILLLISICDHVNPSSDQDGRQDENHRQQRVFLLFFLPARILADRGKLRSDKRPEHEHQNVLEEHQHARFLIIQEREMRPEKQIVRRSVFQEQVNPRSCKTAENHRCNELPFIR